MFVEFASVRCSKITHPIDIVDRVLNCLVVVWAKGDKYGLTVTSNVQADENIDVREWYVAVLFSFIGSVHNIVRQNRGVYSFSIFSFMATASGFCKQILSTKTMEISPETCLLFRRPKKTRFTSFILTDETFHNKNIKQVQQSLF